MKLTLTVTGAQGATLGESAHIVFTNCGGTIGRDESCDWVLPHPLVSRLHAIVRYADEVFTIEDRSTNGTRRVADATRLASGVPEAIHDGDVLVIGPYTVTVKVEPDVVDAEIPAPDDDSSDSSSTRIPADSRYTTVVAPPGVRLDFEVLSYDSGDDSTAAAPPERVAPAAAQRRPAPGAEVIPADYDPLQDLSLPIPAPPLERFKRFGNQFDDPPAPASPRPDSADSRQRELVEPGPPDSQSSQPPARGHFAADEGDRDQGE